MYYLYVKCLQAGHMSLSDEKNNLYFLIFKLFICVGPARYRSKYGSQSSLEKGISSLWSITFVSIYQNVRLGLYF